MSGLSLSSMSVEEGKKKYDSMTAEAIVMPSPLDKIDEEVSLRIGGADTELYNFVINEIKKIYVDKGWVPITP